MRKQIFFLTILLVFISQLLYGQSFTRITVGDFVNDGGDSRGCSWGDYDNDGDIDLFVTNRNQANCLYRNNGDGSFTKITSGIIVSDDAYSQTGSWGDYDNDGDLDLFVANGGNSNNFLYRNEGGGVFSQITDGDIVNDGRDSYIGVWGDYDNDGDLDIFVGNYNDQNNLLYENDGDGTFTQITSGDIVNDGGYTFTSSIADYDNDGDLDIFVVNAHDQNNFLYQNNGDGTFEKITTGEIVTDDIWSTSSCWGDYDNDGDLDLYVTNSEHKNNFLYQNNNDGSFTKITEGKVVTDSSSSICASWGDLDNDGDLDLFVITNENNLLYSNNGDGMFTQLTTGDIVNDTGNFISGCWGDYDKDGDLDLFIANMSNQNNLFYTNDGNDNSWINIKCVNSDSNTSAIGTKVRTKATIYEEPIWQMRMITEYSHRSHNSFNCEFGFGDASVIDSIVIMWPSGIKQILTDVDVNQFLNIKETYLKADFRADTTYGEPPLQVSFTDLSTTNDVSDINIWKWDFDNNGTVDSEIQNPQWTYEQGGIYSVKLIVSNGVLSDTLVREDYIRIISIAESPTILTIRDVPNDQGGWVYIDFIRSIYDTDSLKNQKVTLNSTEFYTVEINDGSGWIAANTTVAYGKYKYSIMVPTPFDSTLESGGKLNFRVIAAMVEGNYASEAVAGYSLDNLAPSAPLGVTAYFYEGDKIKLSWSEPPDNDLNYYRIYRGDRSPPISSIPYTETVETSYLDSQIEPGKTYYYRLTSVDISGNESNFSEEVSVSITSIENVLQTVKEFRLEQNYPNPFNPTTTIGFALPKSEFVVLKVYNTLGQEAATLISENLSAGVYNFSWDASNLPSGIYYYQLKAGSYCESRKLILLK